MDECWSSQSERDVLSLLLNDRWPPFTHLVRSQRQMWSSALKKMPLHDSVSHGQQEENNGEHCTLHSGCGGNVCSNGESGLSWKSAGVKGASCVAYVSYVEACRKPYFDHPFAVIDHCGDTWAAQVVMSDYHKQNHNEKYAGKMCLQKTAEQVVSLASVAMVTSPMLYQRNFHNSVVMPNSVNSD